MMFFGNRAIVLIHNIAARVQLLPQAHNAKRQMCKVRLPQLRRHADMEVPELQGGCKKLQVFRVRL